MYITRPAARQRRHLGVVALAALVLAAAACEPPGEGDDVVDEPDDSAAEDGGDAADAEEPANGEEPATVRVGVIPGASQTYPWRVVVEEGLGEEHGFDVEIVEYGQAGGQYSALRAGEIDIAGGNVLSLFTQRDAGLDIVAFDGFLGFGAPIVAHSDGIGSLEELEGGRFGAPSAGLMDFHLFRATILELHGFDLQDDVELVEAGPPLLNEQLRNQELDAIWQFSNLAYGPVQQGEFVELATVDDLMEQAGMSTDAFYLLWFLHEDWLAEHEDRLADLQAMLRDGNEALAEQESHWPDLAASSGIDDPELVDGYMQDQVIAQMDVEYTPDKLDATQDLIDDLLEVVDPEVLGVTEVDEDAFVFPSQ